jgi:sugar phosphate isomerase/epimerase
MRLGIFAKTFARPSVEGVFDAVRAHGLDCVQFNFACAGQPPLPARTDPILCARIGEQAAQRQITIAAVSGTFNLIDPDSARLRENFARLRQLALACPLIGTSVITICTGTRDPHDMWRRHPDNDSPAAWNDLKTSLLAALELTAETNITLAFEPEVANVIDSAVKARRLLDEIGSPRLKVVLDGANLFHAGELPRMREILQDAVSLLARDVVIAHAKDLSHDGEAGHEAAGTGRLDYDCYLGSLQSAGFEGPLILHGLDESQVAESVAFLRGKISPGTAVPGLAADRRASP